MKHGHRLLVAPGLLALLALCALPSTCQACSCVPQPPEAVFSSAHVVFHGRVVEVEELSEQEREFGTTHRARLSANTVWKGPVQREFLVDGGEGGACGAVFLLGVKYLVFAYGNAEAPLITNYCVMSDGGRATLGAGTPVPDPPSSPPARHRLGPSTPTPPQETPAPSTSGRVGSVSTMVFGGFVVVLAAFIAYAVRWSAGRRQR